MNKCRKNTQTCRFGFHCLYFISCKDFIVVCLNTTLSIVVTCFTLLDEVEDASVDLIVCDGPYGVTDEPWDQIPSIQEFNLNLIKRFTPKLKNGGALYLFGKPDCIDFIDYRKFLNLRSKIVWYQPSRLAQGRINYTNNYDIICYFIKGKKPQCYNLDAIRGLPTC